MEEEVMSVTYMSIGLKNGDCFALAWDLDLARRLAEAKRSGAMVALALAFGGDGLVVDGFDLSWWTLSTPESRKAKREFDKAIEGEGESW